jgi:hypothetical protein
LYHSGLAIISIPQRLAGNHLKDIGGNLPSDTAHYTALFRGAESEADIAPSYRFCNSEKNQTAVPPAGRGNLKERVKISQIFEHLRQTPDNPHIAWYNPTMPLRVVLRNAKYLTVDEQGNYTLHRGDLYATKQKPGDWWMWEPEDAIHHYDLPHGIVELPFPNFARADNEAIIQEAAKSQAEHQQNPDIPYIEILELFEVEDLPAKDDYPPGLIAF